MCVRESVCVCYRKSVCVCQRDRERECVCQKETLCVCVRESVWVCVCVRDRVGVLHQEEGHLGAVQEAQGVGGLGPCEQQVQHLLPGHRSRRLLQPLDRMGKEAGTTQHQLSASGVRNICIYIYDWGT